MDDQELIATYIERDPDKGSRSEARLKHYCIHVWALIGAYQAEGCDAERVAEGYSIPIDAMHAALAYYKRYRELIEDRLEANDGPPFPEL